MKSGYNIDCRQSNSKLTSVSRLRHVYLFLKSDASSLNVLIYRDENFPEIWNFRHDLKTDRIF